MHPNFLESAEIFFVFILLFSSSISRTSVFFLKIIFADNLLNGTVANLFEISVLSYGVSISSFVNKIIFPEYPREINSSAQDVPAAPAPIIQIGFSQKD